MFHRLALILFCIYLALLPGSTIVVALDRVPSGGAWIGGALLLLQGGVALCWLLGRYGARGGVAALLVFLLAWAIEHTGVMSGVPFGRYHYTSVLQPLLLGTVPLAIPCAWLMVAAGAWQLATNDGGWGMGDGGRTTDDLDRGERRRTLTIYNLQSTICNLQLAVAATLVLLLDLQIETVATRINNYWIWLDEGPYYGVPTANFVAWWLAGLAMAWVVAILLGRSGAAASGRSGERLMSYVAGRLPAYLYLLSTLMFTIVNLARGYVAAGLVGALVLAVVFFRRQGILTRRRGGAELERWSEAEV